MGWYNNTPPSKPEGPCFPLPATLLLATRSCQTLTLLIQAGTCWTPPLVNLLNLQKTVIFSTALVNCINSLKNIFQHISCCVAENTKRTEEEDAQKKSTMKSLLQQQPVKYSVAQICKSLKMWPILFLSFTKKRHQNYSH